MSEYRTANYNRRRMLAACCGNPVFMDGCSSCITGNCWRCDACTVGYYIMPDNSYSPPSTICKDCSVDYHPKCTSCTTTSCLTCTPPWEVDPTTNATCRCSSTAFMSGTECLPCLPGCIQCTDDLTCITCKDFFTKSADNTTCTPCVPGCGVCSDETTCTSCSNYFLETVTAGVVSCGPCIPGEYWKSDNLCYPCDSTKCSQCRDLPNFCTACNPGFVLLPKEGLCVSTTCANNEYFDLVSFSCQACNATCNGCYPSKEGNGVCRQCNTASDGSFFKDILNDGSCNAYPKSPFLYKYVSMSGTVVNPYGASEAMVFARFSGRVVGIAPKNVSLSGDGTVSNVEEGCGVYLAAPDKCQFCNKGFARTTPTSCGNTGVEKGGYPTYQPYRRFDPQISGICWYSSGSACTDCTANSYMGTDGNCKMVCSLGTFGNMTTGTCVAGVNLCVIYDNLAVCLQCVDGYLFDSVSNTCKPCSPGCKTCSDLTSSGCIACRAGYQMTSAGTCQLRCPTGFFYNTGTGSCDLSTTAACLTYDRADTSCTSCPSTTHYLVGVTCMQSCPFGKYYDSAASACTPCHPTCTSCRGPLDSDCLSCNRSMTLSATPGTCTFYACEASLVTAGCVECSGTSPVNCIVPPAGKYLNYINKPTVYLKACPENTYYKTATSTCEPCDAACLNCKGPTNQDCANCNDNAVRVGTTCRLNPNNCDFEAGQSFVSAASDTCGSCTDPHCMYCPDNSICEECDNGYFPQGGNCVACPSNTLYCSQSKGMSLACEAGYIIPQYKNCTAVCESNTYYDANTRTCRPCSPDCATCAKAATQCTDCRPGDYMYSSHLLLSTTKRPCHQLKDDSKQGYYVSGANRIACPFPALKCNTATDIVACYRTYYLSSNQCLKCTPPCYDCDTSATFCTSCHMGYKLEANNTCSQICEDYEYFDSVKGYCMKCRFPCRKCSGETSSDCLDCYIWILLVGQ
jgi:proprotein convertase subtilisin/kexin type 5